MLRTRICTSAGEIPWMALESLESLPIHEIACPKDEVRPVIVAILARHARPWQVEGEEFPLLVRRQMMNCIAGVYYVVATMAMIQRRQ